ncbi:MAG: 16S rRNA (guanine(966)-N(2))-methyltransferase RsmD [Ottowia sp.]|nr:16S rRNA (guanine(966)-N(2))-methyltransferase RsmD [Ottowia sp.]
MARRRAGSRPAAGRRGHAAPRKHVVRIIGGQWRGRRIPVLAHPQLRPTPDRVRETLFNWLGQDLSGWQCLDVFAGTGALGLEAASRGAASVLLVEQDAALCRQLQASVERLAASRVRVQHGNGLLVLAAQPAASVDLVLLDPPFELAPLAMEALAVAAGVVRPGGFVYLETATRWPEAEGAAGGLVLHRHARAGAVHAYLLQKPAAVPAGGTGEGGLHNG